MRRDIADVRLAEHVFAPHYAAPLIRRMVASGMLRATPETGGTELVALAAGDPFEVLEISGSNAWGIAPREGLVGYVDAALIEGPTS